MVVVVVPHMRTVDNDPSIFWSPWWAQMLAAPWPAVRGQLSSDTPGAEAAPPRRILPWVSHEAITVGAIFEPELRTASNEACDTGFWGCYQRLVGAASACMEPRVHLVASKVDSPALASTRSFATVVVRRHKVIVYL